MEEEEIKLANHHKHKEGFWERKNFVFYVKWFIIWALIYTGLYVILNFLLTEIFGLYDFFKIKIIYILLIGLFFSILSRIIHDLIKKKRVYIGSNVFLFWTLTYGFSIWFFEFLWNLIEIRFQESLILVSPFAGFIFIGLGIAITIKIIKRIEFSIKHPSQILTGILLIFLGILFFRFSGIIFGTYWPEGMAWSWLFGLAFIIGGFLMILAWWRNNVLQHRIGLRIGKWN